MNWFAPSRVVVVSVPPLDDKSLNKALATDVDGVPTFQAVLQVIENQIEECTRGAIEMVAVHGGVASEVGGIQVLRELREELLRRREDGKKG